MSNYRIRKRVVKPSQKVATGRFSKQYVLWDVISPSGSVVRSFKERRAAIREIELRQQRKTELVAAREEAMSTGAAVTIKRRGRSPVTVSYMT